MTIPQPSGYVSSLIHNHRLEAASVITLLVVWQVVADHVVKNQLFLPSFMAVVRSFVRLVHGGVLPLDIGISLLHFSIGLVAAIVVAIPIGIVMGWFKAADHIVDPIVELLRPIPPLAWIPFAIVWFGLTHISAGFVVFMGAVFPIIINTYSGIRSVPKVYVEAAKVLGCTNNRDIIRCVAIPSSLPSIATGIRVAMGVGWMCLVAAEMFGVSKNGLGYKIWWHYYLHQMDSVMAYMIMLGFIGLLIDRLFRYIVEEKMLKWRSGVVK